MNKFNLLNHIRKEDDSIVVWMLNIGVEQYWNGSKKICKDTKEDIVVNHVEELNLLIACKQDYLILRRRPDEAFLRALEKEGYEIPTIICPTLEDESKSISELVLEDEELLSRLTQIATCKNAYFVPYGVSVNEMDIAKKCNMQLIGGSHEKSLIVNNKIFSKKVARDLELPVAKGIVCHSGSEIQEAYNTLKKEYEKIVVKMPCNSSGQGIWIVDDERKLRSTVMIVERLMRTQGIDEWLVEGWLTKKLDLNLQVYVSEDGETECFSVKEQIIDQALYIGSVMPARISDAQLKQCEEYGVKIGHYLYEKGFSGVFGIDALITADDVIIPIIEINGRFTLSTYISFVQNKYPNRCIYAFFERFRAGEDFNYQKLTEILGDKNMGFDGQKGMFLYNSSTLNAKLTGGNVRAFCMEIEENFEKAEQARNVFVSLCEVV